MLRRLLLKTGYGNGAGITQRMLTWKNEPNQLLFKFFEDSETRINTEIDHDNFISQD